MKLKTLIPFVIVLAVLAGLVFLRQSGNKPASIRTQVGLQNLVSEDVKPSDVKRIVLYAAATPDEKVELVRVEKGWQVASHFNAPVKEETVTEYLEKLSKLQGELRATAKSDEDLANFQLKDDEAFRVQLFTGVNDPAVDLMVGKAPDFKTVFLRKAGDMKVYTEATNPRREAGVNAEDMATAPTADHWEDKSVLALEDTSAVNKVALSTPGKELVFEQVSVEAPAPEPAVEGTEGEQTPPEPVVTKEWKLTQGGGDMPLKPGALTTYTGRLANFTATNIVDPAKKAEYGLDAPTHRATISREGGEDIVIEGAQPEAEGNAYLRVASSDQDLVYEVNNFAFGNLFPKGSTLFDLPKLTLSTDDVSQVVINSAEGRVVANKSGDEWTVTEPATDFVAKPGPLNTLVSTLSNWTPADFAATDADTGDFDRSVEITSAGVVRTISLGKKNEASGLTYAKIDGVDTVLEMSQADIDKVLLAPGAVFNLEVLNLAASDVNAVDYRKGEDRMSLRRTDTGWTVAVNDAAPFDPDTDQAEAFVNDIVSITPESARFDQSKIEGDPHLTLTVQAASGLPRFITVGAEADGVYPLAVSGKSTVFEVGKLGVDKITVKGEALKVKPEAPAPVEMPAITAPNATVPPVDLTTEVVTAPAAAEGAAVPPPASDAPAAEDDWDELSVGGMSGQPVL